MKEEHQDKLAELLIGYTEKAGETTGTIVEWLQIQAPELCSEIITYNMVYHGLLASAMAVLVLVCIILVVWVLRKADTEDDASLALAPLTLAILPTVFFFASLNVFLKCYFAPKLFLLEYMKGFI